MPRQAWVARAAYGPTLAVMQDQKRHHFVPEFYLLLATESERVLERRRDGVEFVTNTDNVAAASGFYEIGRAHV